jgi:hypothetical protein
MNMNKKIPFVLSLLVIVFSNVKAVEHKDSPIQEIQINSYSSAPIVISAVEKTDEELKFPEIKEIEATANLDCNSLGYTFHGKYSLNPMHDQKMRGPIKVFKMMKNGRFKEIQASKIYSFNSITCKAPVELECRQSHFGMHDLRFIKFQREECF